MATTPFFVVSDRGPIAQSVEHRADNAGVTGAIPVRPTTSLHQPVLLFEENRLPNRQQFGPVAQLGERLICIQEVSGSIPLRSTRF